MKKFATLFVSSLVGAVIGGGLLFWLFGREVARLHAYSLTPPTSVSEPFHGFEITDRHLGSSSFGVPFVRSGLKYGNHKPTALDVGPRGRPADEKNSDRAWIDVCNADLIQAPEAPVDCLYLGAWGERMVLGSRSFSGSKAKPLYLRAGNKIVGKISEQGLEIYGSITAHSVIEAQPPSPQM